MEDYEIKIEIECWKCLKCGHIWKKNKFKSKRCPNRKCKSPYFWDTHAKRQIEREIKAELERIFDEINTQLRSRVIGTWYCDNHGISKLQYYPCCDKASFDEEGRYDWIWQALDHAKRNLMNSDEPTNKNETEGK